MTQAEQVDEESNSIKKAKSRHRFIDFQPASHNNANSSITALYAHTLGFRLNDFAEQVILCRRYLIKHDDCLGEGAFSRVFAGRDLFSDSPCAIKRMRPQYNRIGQEVLAH